MTIKTYKFKLYRAKKNKHLHHCIDTAGSIWNHCIALHKVYYRLTRRHLSQYELMAHLAKLKKRPAYISWNLIGSQAIQEIVQRIERAYARFFNSVRNNIKASPPGFKKIEKYSSFTLKWAGWRLWNSNRIKILNRVYKFSKSRDIPMDVKTLTIKRDTLGNLWLCFIAEVPVNEKNQVMTGNSAGFDFGLKTFLTLDDGQVVESPLYLQQALTELRQAQRNLSRKVKFSHNWQKARLVVARIYARVVNRRRDWFFKLAHALTDQYDYLFFEDLNMMGMMRLWGRKVKDLARSEFMGILTHVASNKGKTVRLISRFYPSSKTCSTCGCVYRLLQLKERRWTCAHCGTVHDRDINAAINIRREGASSLGLGTVSLARASACC